MENKVFSKIVNAFWLIFIFAVVALGLLWFAYTFNIFSFRDSISSFLESGELSEESDVQLENKILHLIDASYDLEEDQYTYLELSSDKARELLYSFEPPENCYWEVETVSGVAKDKKTQVHRIYKKGDKIRVDTVDKFVDTTTVFSGSETVIKNNKTGEIRKISNDTDFSYDNIINIAALDYLFYENDQSVSFVSVSSADGEEFLYVEIPKINVSGKDLYFISLKYGIVSKATSEINSEIVFSQKTLKIDTTSVISDETFEVLIEEQQ